MQTCGVTRTRSCLAFCLALFLAVSVLEAAPACPSVALDPAPGWITSALWQPGPQGGTILAVDSTLLPAGRVVSISPSGKGSIVAQAGESAPVLLASSSRGPILKLLGVDALVLSGGPSGLKTDFLRAPVAGTRKVGSIYQWAGLGDSLLLFGSLRYPIPQKGFELGLMRMPVPGSIGEPSLLSPAPIKGDYYLLGPPYQYVAALGSTGIFLKMESQSQAEFFEVTPGAKQARPFSISGIPEQFLEVPEFNGSISGPTELPHLYEQVEDMVLAAGIYGSPDGKQLFLLTRQPISRNQTEWQFLRIDPAAHRVVGKFVLPTTAPEIIPVFSPDTLFVIERRDMDRSGTKAMISKMIKIPLSLVSTAGMTGAETCTR
jgi:hypothetical protein